MDSITKQIQRRKNLMALNPDLVPFVLSVVQNAWALRQWNGKMMTSMRNYREKVHMSIAQIFRAGAKLLTDSNHPRMHRWMKRLLTERDRCEIALKNRCEEMYGLIKQVMTCVGNNSHLKQKVLDLLQVMRQPALPNITFIYRAFGRKMPGNKMRSVLPFRRIKKTKLEYQVKNDPNQF